MANSGQPGSTGSQFFIVYGDSPAGPDLHRAGHHHRRHGPGQGGRRKAGDDGAFAQQAGGGHPKKEVIIKDLTMSNPQG